MLGEMLEQAKAPNDNERVAAIRQAEKFLGVRNVRKRRKGK